MKSVVRREKRPNVYSMNVPCLTRLLLPLLLIVALGGARALAYDDEVAQSPDHPTTWVDGATRTHQALHWSPENHLLSATVTYSTANFADATHPTEDDTFSLAFPTVHFDAASGNFTAGGQVVARLHHGLFGDGVELAPGVTLSIHRHSGVVVGKLLVSHDG
jgi:hypothetical protein